MKELEEQSRFVFQAMRDAMGVSKMGNHLLVTAAYAKLFGYDDEQEVLGKTVIDLIAPSHRDEIRNNIYKRAAGEEAPTFYETGGLRKDGTEFEVEVQVSKLDWYGEEASLVIMRDISERKRAQLNCFVQRWSSRTGRERTQQLAKEKEMLSTTLRSIGDAVIATQSTRT